MVSAMEIDLAELLAQGLPESPEGHQLKVGKLILSHEEYGHHFGHPPRPRYSAAGEQLDDYDYPNPEDLAALVRRCQGLTSIVFKDWADLTDEMLDVLTTCPALQLEELVVRNCSRALGLGLRSVACAFGHCLRVLHTDLPLTNHTLLAMAQSCGRLESIAFLVVLLCSVDGLKTLFQANPALTEVHLIAHECQSSQLSGEQILSVVQHLPNVQVLQLPQFPSRVPMAAILRACPKLTSFVIEDGDTFNMQPCEANPAYTMVTNCDISALVEAIACLTADRSCGLSVGLTTEDLKMHMASDLVPERIQMLLGDWCWHKHQLKTDASVISAFFARFHHLRQVILQADEFLTSKHEEVPLDAIRSIGQCHLLEQLELVNIPNLTDGVLLELLGQCALLKQVRAHCCTSISDGLLEQAAVLAPQLEVMDVSETSVTSKGIQHLFQHHKDWKLKTLGVSTAVRKQVLAEGGMTSWKADKLAVGKGEQFLQHLAEVEEAESRMANRPVW